MAAAVAAAAGERTGGGDVWGWGGVQHGVGGEGEVPTRPTGVEYGSAKSRSREVGCSADENIPDLPRNARHCTGI